MKCSTLFENIKRYWPSELCIDENIEDQLNQLYWDADAKIDNMTEHWLSISSWAFHQAIGVYVEQQQAMGKNYLIVSEMPLILFNKQMLFNLQEECWIEERNEYKEP